MISDISRHIVNKQDNCNQFKISMYVWRQCITPCMHIVHTTVAENQSVWLKEMYLLQMRGTPCHFYVATRTMDYN